MKTTITVTIRPTPGPFQIMAVGTADRHEITITRPTKANAILALIGELIKVGGSELKLEISQARILLDLLIDSPRPTRSATAANILKDVNPA